MDIPEIFNIKGINREENFCLVLSNRYGPTILISTNQSLKLQSYRTGLFILHLPSAAAFQQIQAPDESNLLSRFLGLDLR